jgi:hypothetical protein
MPSKDDERRAQQALIADPRSKWLLDVMTGLTWNGEPPNWALDWARTGDGQAPLAVTVHHAQSLANLEAAVRAEYAGVVEAVESIRDTLNSDDSDTDDILNRCNAAVDALDELETLKNG